MKFHPHKKVDNGKHFSHAEAGVGGGGGGERDSQKVLG